MVYLHTQGLWGPYKVKPGVKSDNCWMMGGWENGQMDRQMPKRKVSTLVLLVQSYEVCVISVPLLFSSPKLSLMSSEEWIFLLG